MTQGKYDKLVIPKSFGHVEPWPDLNWVGDEDYGTDISFIITQIREPAVMEEYPHSHDFDMYLHFVSYDPDHMDELAAEIRIGLGEEREMYTITKPSSVFIPRGLIHCPLEFVRVDKPIMMFHTTIAPKYAKDPDLIIKD